MSKQWSVTRKQQPRSTRNNRFHSINPAFLAAHNLIQNNHNHNDDVSRSSRTRTSLDQALDQARDTGKLCVAGGMLQGTQDLARCFDLRADLKKNDDLLCCDYDNDDNLLEQTQRSHRMWECHGQEALMKVDFSDNDFSVLDVVHCSLDSRIECYRSVQTLRARRCNLKSIDCAALGCLRTLSVLDLSGNQIQSFDLTRLPISITELDLSCNKIDDLQVLPTGIIEFHDLVSLNLSENLLRALPMVVVPTLRDLCFSSNRIVELPASFLNPLLTSLDGSNNQIANIPDLSGLKKLLVIELSGNKLETPPCIGDRVQRLGLSNNSISSLNGIFCNDLMQDSLFRANLVDLRIRLNKLVTIDEKVLLHLTRLVSLDVASNDLSALPSILGYLPDLQKLIVDGNPLRRMRSALTMDITPLKKALRSRGPKPNGEDYLDAEEQHYSVKCGTSLQISSKGIDKLIVNALSSTDGTNVLNMNDINLSSLQGSISNAIGNKEFRYVIRKLHVRRSHLFSLDESLISCLPSIIEVDAGMNKLSDLPKSLSKTSISTLIIDNNQLTAASISPSLNPGSVLSASLVHCDLAKNQLNAIPNALLELPILRTLILAFNQIKSISNWSQSSLPSLETLDLSQNRLDEFGDFPVNCRISSPTLAVLMLQNNEIKNIPLELGLLTSLRQVNFRGNPQKSVRTSVLEKPCSEILLFLRRRLDPDMDPVDVNFYSKINPLQNQDRKNSPEKKDVASQIFKTPTNSELVIKLKQQISELSTQLDEFGLSEAKRHAVKKNMSILRSKLIREERRLKLS